MGNTTSSGLPVAGIIAIAVGSWTLLILIFLGIRQLLFYKGVCTPGSDCAPCGQEDSGGCCACCVALNESDSCCKGPSVGGCLDKVCPNRKSVSCVDILLCQCCGGAGGNCFTNTLQPQNNKTCEFSCPQCDVISCCCFEIKLKQPT